MRPSVTGVSPIALSNLHFGGYCAGASLLAFCNLDFGGYGS